MNTNVLFGGGADTLILEQAILLYVSQGDKTMLASINPVEEGRIMAGRPLCMSDLSSLVAKLTAGTGTGERSVFPERVLYADASLLAWWCPAKIRPIFFRSGREDLDSLSGLDVAHPSLFFVARPQALSVWALKELVRPDAETPVFVAPYFNLYEKGNMCIGNVRLPETLRATNANLKVWEEAFFETNFTHSNRGGKALTHFEGGHDALWKAMREEFAFPSDSLVPMESTVGAILAKGGAL